MINYFRLGVCLAVAKIGLLGASPPSEATPWTKSFLESRTVASMERYSIGLRGNRFASTPHNQLQGTLFASSAPLQDVEIDIGIQGRSLPTGKLFVRAERQVFSDLAHDPLALTLVVDASTSGHERSSSPVFFEMAKSVGECGIGVGRHLINRKEMYTQLFAYLMGGVGTSKARYASGEIGLAHVLSSHHYFRASFTRMKTFGSGSGAFHGIGTLKTDVNIITASYAYRWYSGIEMRVTYIRRMLMQSGIRSSTTCQVGLSLPISL